MNFFTEAKKHYFTAKKLADEVPDSPIEASITVQQIQAEAQLGLLALQLGKNE